MIQSLTVDPTFYHYLELRNISQEARATCKTRNMSQFFSTTLDAAWLSDKLNCAVTRVSFDESDLVKLNTTSGIRFASAETADGATVKLVIKVSVEGQPMSIMMGLAREAYFYKSWSELKTIDGAACELGSVLPIVYHAEGSMATGAKIIVMQDLSSSCVQLGHLFGGGNPNNWGKDLDALALSRLERQVGIEEATRLAFSAAAKLHAPYWRSESLLLRDVSWLRGAAWLRGEGEESWVDSQANLASLWAKVKAKIESGRIGGTVGEGEEYKVAWDPLLVQCVDAAIAKAATGGFKSFQAELKARPFTLTHGDFHPANMLLKTKPSDPERQEVLLMDWEAVGVGMLYVLVMP